LRYPSDFWKLELTPFPDKPSWGATTWIWTSEVFSMNVRAQAVGMASQTQNIANIVCQQFFPIFLNKTGFYCFYMFAGINVLLAIFVIFCVPETRNIPLEEIDVLFGGSNHVEQGVDLIDMQNGKRMSESVGGNGSLGGNKGEIKHDVQAK
jgi:hypothetical protein